MRNKYLQIYNKLKRHPRNAPEMSFDKSLFSVYHLSDDDLLIGGELKVIQPRLQRCCGNPDAFICRNTLVINYINFLSKSVERRNGKIDPIEMANIDKHFIAEGIGIDAEVL